jgi:acyl carrier protein
VTSSPTDLVDTALIRDVVMQVCAIDIGDVDRDDRLADRGLVGLDMLACLAELERRFGIGFPDDLVAALSTVDDLIHYTNLKREQR